MRNNFLLGLDIGSTTVKLVVVNKTTNKAEYSKYKRHNARQLDTVKEMLGELQEQYEDTAFSMAVCGSGGKPVAQALGVPYVQEVVANAKAILTQYKAARTAVELGGQDAKVIFFQYDEVKDELSVNDMRMNGSCAGGTGAFIDEIATLLNVPTEEFNALAEKGETVYDISGRCGVFAKTDIQPLLIQGARREDIALSTFHAIAKQTIGGLSQGLELKPPVIFEGGPLKFNPVLVQVFAQRLGLQESEVMIPKHGETIVAYGTALAAETFQSGEEGITLKNALNHIEKNYQDVVSDIAVQTVPFFENDEQRDRFFKRHNQELKEVEQPELVKKDGILPVYIGIDSGSTTSKIVLLDENERVIDRFYANNLGVPLEVIKRGFTDLYNKYKRRGITLQVLGLGTTGYGEKMTAEAFGADFHVVETVAHAEGCKKYIPDASFILDIGGQDMKAIWLNDGVVTNILLNEACSSGCGSFLENFANTLGIPVEEIANVAFSAEYPATLGSRCTVFMNSTIINEQRNGKTESELMAGLCRSIIENVFTKVIRVSNMDDLGNRIVVQGGTFRNFAVLKALEEYTGKEVILAPYPGEMGALGTALLTKQQSMGERKTNFIGFEEIANFEYKTKTGVKCPYCANHCSRTILSFSTGRQWVTGNRCERGAQEDNAESRKKKPNEAPTDLFVERNKLLFKDYDYKIVSPKKEETIGLPRVLEFWDSMPFWTTFFKALGYQVKISRPSTKEYYEKGISYVASDTICFPAKLVHGHIIDLAEQGVDRIFFPYIMHMPPEGTDKLSPYVCSIVQGYPMVVNNSQNPSIRYNLKYDTPVFHWFTESNRRKQVIEYACKELGVTKKEAKEAFEQAGNNLKHFRKNLVEKGKAVIEEVQRTDSFAVVLAGRPYHSDSFINHNLSKKFTSLGIPVLTVDSLPGLNEVDLTNTRAEITNNFHTRMLSGAVIAAKTKGLEYVQIISFGCGHDAILSDEIVRITKEISNQSPLLLKVDESDASGALDIRVHSFVESVKLRNRKYEYLVKELETAFPYKFYKKDKQVRTIIIPNISENVSILLGAILKKEGFIPKTVDIGGLEQIHIGKKYSHNDICFPCQMVIGELIDELQKGGYKQEEVAVGMVKFQCDCRMSHYAALLRKALDGAGFEKVPVISTDFNDSKKSQPGVMLLGPTAAIDAIWVFLMMDILTDFARKIRPYESNPGETDRILHDCVCQIGDAIQDGIPKARKVFTKCVDAMGNISYDRSTLKPRVLVTGELLVTYHPGSNFAIEKYLEDSGMETIFPRVTDQLRKDFLASLYEIKDYHANIFPYPYVVDAFFDHVQNKLEKVASVHPLYEEALRPRDSYTEVEDIIPITLSCGEGWLMAAEIAHYAKEGVKSFVILQPFGCIPNHICGRGVIKRLKDEYPDIQILPLDLDPDTSYANVENRLQMLIMNTNEN